MPKGTSLLRNWPRLVLDAASGIPFQALQRWERLPGKRWVLSRSWEMVRNILTLQRSTVEGGWGPASPHSVQRVSEQSPPSRAFSPFRSHTPPILRKSLLSYHSFARLFYYSISSSWDIRKLQESRGLLLPKWCERHTLLSTDGCYYFLLEKIFKTSDSLGNPHLWKSTGEAKKSGTKVQ